MRVVLGAHRLEQPEESQQVFGIEESIAHPLYDPRTVDNDIRLLRVSPAPPRWGSPGGSRPVPVPGPAAARCQRFAGERRWRRPRRGWGGAARAPPSSIQTGTAPGARGLQNQPGPGR